MSLTATDIFNACSLFARVQSESRERLIRMLQLRKYERGQTIFHQGDESPGVFIVGSGLVRIYKLSPAGKEHVLHLCPPGQIFLEVAVILGMDCPAFAEAVEDTTCAMLPATLFSRALKEDHQLCLQLMAGMAMRVHQFVGLLENIVLRDALARVAQYLITVSGEQGSVVNLPSLKKHLASHLNLTSETLSRCLRQLIDAEMIVPEGQALRIADTAALKDVAEGVFPRL